MTFELKVDDLLGFFSEKERDMYFAKAIAVFVLFAGIAAHASARECELSLYFSSRDGDVDADFAEVSPNATGLDVYFSTKSTEPDMPLSWCAQNECWIASPSFAVRLEILSFSELRSGRLLYMVEGAGAGLEGDPEETFLIQGFLSCAAPLPERIFVTDR